VILAFKALPLPSVPFFLLPLWSQIQSHLGPHICCSICQRLLSIIPSQILGVAPLWG
jgi:hypothetical protein